MNLMSGLVYLGLVLAAVTSQIASGAATEKVFQAGSPSQYAHQESEKVTIGAKPYTSEESIESAFGKKIDFLRYGVVPVLIVIENKRDQTLDLRELEASLVAVDGRHVNAVTAADLPSLASGKHPSPVGVKSPVPLPKKKNPLNNPEIDARAFSVKMLPPGDSGSGFVYFEAKPEPGDKLYVNGMRDARSGKELLYFEFPLEKQP